MYPVLITSFGVTPSGDMFTVSSEFLVISVVGAMDHGSFKNNLEVLEGFYTLCHLSVSYSFSDLPLVFVCQNNLQCPWNLIPK